MNFSESQRMSTPQMRVAAWVTAGALFGAYVWWDRRPKTFKDSDADKWNDGVQAKLKAKASQAGAQAPALAPAAPDAAAAHAAAPAAAAPSAAAKH